MKCWGSGDWNETPNASWKDLASCGVDHCVAPGPQPATPDIRTSSLCCSGTIRAIHGVCSRWRHAYAFAEAFSSLSLVQSQAPSLIVVTIYPPDDPPQAQNKQKTGLG